MGLRFPNEPDDYRRARNELLEAEKRLRRQIEEVAELRRKLPLGGKVPEDYVFDEAAGGPARAARRSSTVSTARPCTSDSARRSPS